MISKWRLANFKSIDKPLELECKPLTIFAGANSSGKSTVLQSILLVSQTLASNITNRSVVLNGPLVKLGQFDDVRNHFSVEKRITIGWECAPTAEALVAPPLTPSQPRGYEGLLDTRSTVVEISFDTGDEDTMAALRQLQPSLSRFNFACTVSQPDGAPIDAKLTVERTSDPDASGAAVILTSNMPPAQAETIKTGMSYRVAMDENSRKALLMEDPGFEPRGCLFQHFLPNAILTTYEEQQALADALIRALLGEKVLRIFHDAAIPPEALNLLTSLRLPQPYRQALGLSRRTGSPPRSLRETYFRARKVLKSPKRRAQIQRRLEAARLRLYALICKSDRPKLEWRPAPIPDPLHEALRYTQSWFSTSIRYLGPLRDEPRPVYPLAPTPDPYDIGTKGEHTAAVLDLHKTQEVRYLPPPRTGGPPRLEHAKSAPLEDAVLEWLNYLGVATRFQTLDLGSQGHQLKVRTFDNDYPHDLTHVGVGTSQVLPVVVTCLLAPPGATLVFEQPELHLHPQVQTRLADFFLSTALLGKQCIIETHSEYIVNRLRFGAAAAPGESISSVFQLYFVEKEKSSSTFHRVDVNRFGAIDDWPEGFFDQSQREAENIVRAALAKDQAEQRSKK